MRGKVGNRDSRDVSYFNGNHKDNKQSRNSWHSGWGRNFCVCNSGAENGTKSRKLGQSIYLSK